MIPKIYFDNPYPVNVPAEYLTEFYINNNKEKNKKDLMEEIQSLILNHKTCKNARESKQKALSLYREMLIFYMRQNFDNKGVYLIIHNSYNLVKACEEDGDILKFFKSNDIDLTHLFGSTKEDLHILIVPFKTLKSARIMKNKLKNTNTIEIWNGARIL